MQAWAGLILLSLNPGIWQHLTPIMSESIYLTCSLATLVYFTHLEKQEGLIQNELLDWGKCLKLAILSLFSFYARTLGVTLILAVTFHLWFNVKQKKAAALYAFFCLLGILPWILYTQQIQAHHPFYQTQIYPEFILFPYTQSYFQHYGLQIQSVGLWEFLLNNLSALWETFGKIWFPVQDIAEIGFLSPVLSGVSLMLLSISFVKSRHHFPLAWTHSLITVLACLMWYDTHQYYRFLMMVFPLILGGVLFCVSQSNLFKTPLKVIGSVVIGASMVWGYQSYFALQPEGHFGKTQWARNSAAYHQAFQWIQNNTTPQDKIYTRFFTMMPLYTHRASMAYNDIIPEWAHMTQRQQQEVLLKMEIEKFKTLNPQYLLTEKDSTLIKLFPDNFVLKAAQAQSPLRLYQVRPDSP
jgi:hypothetical protein